ESRVISGPEELRETAIQTALLGNFAISTARSLQVIMDFKLPAAGTGEIAGTTTDASRVPIPGVTVTATNAETGLNVAAVSNESGTYRFLSVMPGTYRLKARLGGFWDVSYNNVRLGDSQRIQLNFALKPTYEGSSRAWSIPAISPISLPDQFPAGEVQNLIF